MKKNPVLLVLSLCFFAGLISSPARADEPANLVEYTPGEGIAVEALDFYITPTSTFLLQGSPNPNNAKGGKFGYSWVLYLDMKKEFGDWGVAAIQLKNGVGNTVNNDMDLFSDVNYNSYDVGGNIRARKFWYEQFLFDKQLTIKCGKTIPEHELGRIIYAWDDDTQFLTYLADKFPAIEWPEDYCFTIYSILHPDAARFFEFKFNFFEADADWERIFKNGMYTWEIDLKPAYLFDLDPEQWDGNYKLYGFINSLFHTKLTNEGQARSSRNKEMNYGFGFTADQKITDVFAVFGRLGWQRPDIIPSKGGATIYMAWLAGARMTGKYWKRENDVFAFLVGQDVPSEQYKKAGNPGLPEGHFEIYYSYQLNKVFTISPDFQLVWNPNGDGNSPDNPVFAYGLRIHIAL